MEGASMVQLLRALSSADNAVRQTAETHFSQLKLAQGVVATPLLLVVGCEGEYSTRKLAMVLLRRYVCHENAYSGMSEHVRSEFRGHLLQAHTDVSDAYLKGRIADTIGHIIGYEVDIEEWQEALPFVFSCVSSSDAVVLENGLALVGFLSIKNVSLITSDRYLQSLGNILETCLLNYNGNTRLPLAALRCVASVIGSVHQASSFPTLQRLIRSLYSALYQLIQFITCKEHETSAIAYIEVLIDLAEDNINSLLVDIASDIRGLLHIIENKAVSATIRHMILEYVIVITENAPKYVRKIRGDNNEKSFVLHRLLPICVDMMSTLPDDPSWHLSSDEDEDVEETFAEHDVGETSLDRLTKALGLKSTFAALGSCVGSMLASSDWIAQHNALRILGNYLELTVYLDKRVLAKHRADVTAIIARFCGHEHMRVRCAALYAAGQLLLMHGETLPEPIGASMLKLVVHSANHEVNPFPRVLLYVFGALLNLIDNVSSAVLEAQVEVIVHRLIDSLVKGPLAVQEYCVLCLHSMAETMPKPSFAAYYDRLIPVLKQFLVYLQSQQAEDLLGQTIETVCMIGESAGRDVFYADATEMVTSLQTLQNRIDAGGVTTGSTLEMHLLKAWVRIARCMGAEFEPFLEPVVLKLLRLSTQDLSAEAVDDAEFDKRSDIVMVETETGWQPVRSSAVEEQGVACQLLLQLLEKLQLQMYRFIEPITTSIAPLVNSPHDDVRSFSLAILPELVSCTAKANVYSRENVTALFAYILEVLLNTIQSESVVELVMTGLQAAKSCLQNACVDWSVVDVNGSGCTPPTPRTSLRILSTQQMEAISQCCRLVLKDSLQRRAVMRAEARVSGGVEEEDVEDETIFMSASTELHFNISELLGMVLRTHGADYLPVFMSVWQEAVHTMAHPNCLKEDRQFAFFIICDVIEFGIQEPAQAKEYFEVSIPFLVQCCKGEYDPGLRQSCSYALGISAERFPLAFEPYRQIALEGLTGCIAMGENEEERRGMCTDNAVSAIGIIIESIELHNPEAYRSQLCSMWTLWLDCLPLVHDEEEGQKVIRQLLRCFDRSYPRFLDDASLVDRAAIVLLEVLGSHLSSKELDELITRLMTSNRIMAERVQLMKNTMPPNLLQKLKSIYTSWAG